MSIKSKFAAALAIAALAGGLAIPTSEAHAGKGWGIGAAIVGSAIVGAAVANSAYAQPVYVSGHRRCHWQRRYDGLGFYVGTVKVCHYY